MKRAKIMLSALAVLAVVGSALAFKANSTFGGNLRCNTTTTVETTDCPVVTYSTTASNGVVLPCTLIGAPAGTPCILQTVTANP